MNKKLVLAAIAALALTLPIGISTAQEKSSATYRQLNLFGDVFERVRADYVEEVSDKELIENAINGMLTALDPHSSYLNEKNYRDMQVQTKGEFGGLGIEVTLENGLVKVVSPIDDTPAFRAGIQPQDLITHLDGEQILGLTLQQAVERMRGKVNTDIRLTIRRKGRDPFDVTLTRAIIKIRSVRSRIEQKNIGYVRITSFNEQTHKGLVKAMEKLRADAEGGLKGVVLDLRNNPGGLLDQAVAV
ncbi:MAG: S41 family peptidase, partial [Proteobacteria bacterium]|nr:S41 family peptidase [Pseudomonadota bacterium]